MPSFRRETVIERAPATVFAVLDDLEQAPKWMPAIRKIEVLTPGQTMGVGFKWRETRRVLGFIPVKVPLTVTGHDAPHHWRLSYDDGKMRMDATFELKAKGAGTHITLLEEAEALTASEAKVARMLASVEKQDGDLLERLKAHVEATTPAAAPATKGTSRPKAAAKKTTAKGKAKKAR